MGYDIQEELRKRNLALSELYEYNKALIMTFALGREYLVAKPAHY